MSSCRYSSVYLAAEVVEVEHCEVAGSDRGESSFEIALPPGTVRLSGRLVLADLSKPSTMQAVVITLVDGVTRRTDTVTFAAPLELDESVEGAARVAFVISIHKDSVTPTGSAYLQVALVNPTYLAP